MNYTLICSTDLGLERIRMNGMFLPIKEERDIRDLLKVIGRDDIIDIRACLHEGEIVWVNKVKYQPSLF